MSRTLKVFRLNDAELWCHYSLEEAIALALDETGLTPDEHQDDPHEVTAEDLAASAMHDEDGKPDGTLADELTRRTEPGFFAGSEW